MNLSSTNYVSSTKTYFFKTFHHYYFHLSTTSATLQLGALAESEDFQLPWGQKNKGVLALKQVKGFLSIHLKVAATENMSM